MRLLLILLIVIAVFSSGETEALELGVGVGVCDIQGMLNACDDGGWLMHLYIKQDFYTLDAGYGLITFGVEGHHYSAPEKSDLNYGGGSGAFDYMGGYIRWLSN